MRMHSGLSEIPRRILEVAIGALTQVNQHTFFTTLVWTIGAILVSFEKLRKARNAIQRFCLPAQTVDLRRIALDFLNANVDPLINKHFNLCAIEYHEDHVGYDYVVDCLIQHELLFSIPDGFSISEVDLAETLSRTSEGYRKELENRFRIRGFDLTKIVGTSV